MSLKAQTDATETPFYIGILNCFLGFVGILFSSIAMGLPSDILEGDFGYNFVGTGEGVWCGIFLISTGIVGILTKVKETTSGSLFIASGVLGILTSTINFVGFGLCLAAIFVYSYILWNATFISLYIVIATVCFAAIPLGIVHATYSFRARSYSSAYGNARLSGRNDLECAVAVATPSGKSAPRSTRSNTNAIFGVGITEVILGLVIFALAIACVTITTAEARAGTGMEWLAFGYSGVGIWGGLLICLSGTAGIVHKYKPDVATINVNMSFSIFAASTSFMIIIVNLASAITPVRILIALHATIGVLAVFSAIACIMHASYCCKSVCMMQDVRVVMSVPEVPTSPTLRVNATVLQEVK